MEAGQEEEKERFFLQLATHIVGCKGCKRQEPHVDVEEEPHVDVEEKPRVDVEDKQLVYLATHGPHGVFCHDENHGKIGYLPKAVATHISRFMKNHPTIKPEAIISLRTRAEKMQKTMGGIVPVCIAFCGHASGTGRNSAKLEESLTAMIGGQTDHTNSETREVRQLPSLKELKKKLVDGKRKWDGEQQQKERSGRCSQPHFKANPKPFGPRWFPVKYHDTNLICRGASVDIISALEVGGIVIDDFDDAEYQRFLLQAKRNELAIRFDDGQFISPIIEAEKGTVKTLPKHASMAKAFEDMYSCKKSNLPAVAQPSGVTSKMYRHQLEGLAWVLEMEKERNVKDVLEKSTRMPKPKSALFWKKKTTKGKEEWINEMTQKRQDSPPSYPRGGMLCDDMGLGKTLTMLAAVVSHPKPSNTRGTMVVCPLGVMSSWVAQIRQHTPSLNVCEYHGVDRQLVNCDIFITSFHTLANSKDELCKHTWHRIIIDEAHEVRNRTAKKSQAVAALCEKANIIWAVTGTPLQNTIKDFFVYAKILKLAPFDQWEFFNRCILRAAKRKGGDGLGKLVSLIQPFLLRRDKLTKDNNKKLIVDLPKKTSSIEKVKMTAEEQSKYNELWNVVKYDVSQAGQQNFGWKALVAILRARQLACSSDLLPEEWKKEYEKEEPDFLAAITKGFNRNASSGGSSSSSSPLTSASDLSDQQYRSILEATLTEAGEIEDRQDGEVDECSICMEKMDITGGEDGVPAILAPCKHIFHVNCITTVLETQNRCPLCRHEGPRVIGMPTTTASRFSQPSSKMEKIVELIRQHEPKPGKVVIFSMYKSFLDILNVFIKQQFNDAYVKQVDGSVTGKKRAEIVQTFQEDDITQVILCSTKAAGCGVTLTAGSLVIISDPWWCPAVEMQAEDRCHRIGQKNPVHVVRVVAQDTIEPKILNMQEGKKRLMTLIDQTPEDAKEYHKNELLKLFDAPWAKKDGNSAKRQRTGGARTHPGRASRQL